MKKKKPTLRLSEAERKIEAEIDSGIWKSVDKNEAHRLHAEMVESASSGNKDARVNLRLNPEDVMKIREKAEREGIPYQTLIASVLHKYATDQFLDENAVLTVVRKMGKKKAAG